MLHRRHPEAAHWARAEPTCKDCSADAYQVIVFGPELPI